MPQRRRINTPSVGRRSFLLGLAATAAAAPLASFGFRTSPKLIESTGSSPISASVNTVPLTDALSVLIDDAAVATQALTDALHPLRGVVKEIRRAEKFSQFALTWDGDPNLDVFIRAEREDGSWSEWFPADAHAPMSKSDSINGTELLYVEPTNAVQISTGGINIFGPGSGVNLQDIVGIEQLNPTQVDFSALGLPQPSGIHNLQDVADAISKAGTAITAAATTTDWTAFAPIPGKLALDTVQAVFVDGQPQSGEIISPIAFDSWAAGAPSIISRAAWGADESIRSHGVETYQTFKGTCVHHTAGSNNYTQAEAAGVVRGIYAYHAKTLGWGDIGYNALVDKFGNIYEGRYGGLDKNIEGAHAGGFNDGTFGISMIGNYETITPPAATLNSVGEMIGWRMKVGGVDPLSETSLTSAGFSRARYAKGQSATLPAIFAHRDTGYTTCPGNVGYTQMDKIRSIAKAKFDGASNDGNNAPRIDFTAPGASTGDGQTENNAQPAVSIPPQAAQVVGDFIKNQLPVQ